MSTKTLAMGGAATAAVLVVLFLTLPLTRLPVPEPTPPTAPQQAAPPSYLPPARSTTQPPARKAIPKNSEAPTAHASRPIAATPAPDDEEAIIAIDGKRYPRRVYHALALPNDPYASQWWTSASGLEAAWNYAPGSTPTSVAVIDTGFALAHEEFTNRWLTNSGESGTTSTEAPSDLNCTDQSLPLDQSCNNIDDDYDGVVDNESGATSQQNPSDLNCTDQSLALDKSCNNIDDDGNGFLDDTRGWDFANFDASVQAGEVNPAGAGTTHGTMVGGILAATANNGRGIAGVNWTTKILPLQALDDDSYGDTLTVARAIYYAADRDVDVISISLGASAEDPYLREAIAYALEQGSVVVAATGNDGCNCVNYPANYPEVVAVGAMAPDGGAASFSNYGTALDIMAPGENMIAPTWRSSAPTNSYASGVNGTSFSTPYVSGLLALARSHQPNASWGELVSALTEQADHRSLTSASPHSTSIGYGYAQADALLSRVTASSSPLLRYQFGPIAPADTLDSSRVYQCADNRLPTTRLYSLTSGTEIRYTASYLTRYQALNNGWSSQPVAYVCAGLPTDTPQTLRTINLLREINSQ